jgi:pantetheine-phosphate adenylyltransferase
MDYAQELGASFLLRGVRSSSDFEYESGMRLVNERICSFIETVFLIPPRDLSEVSSSVVKGLVGFRDWETIVSQYVPSTVHERLVAKWEGEKS